MRAGLSGKPEGSYSTELLADDMAAFMKEAGPGAELIVFAGASHAPIYAVTGEFN